MNDDDVTQLLLIPTTAQTKSEIGPGSQLQSAREIRAPMSGSRDAGETYWGETDPGGQGASSRPVAQLPAAERRRNAARGSREAGRAAKATQAFGLRRAVAFAALAGIALALGLSPSAPQPVAPAEQLARPSAPWVPPSPALPRAPETQVFLFEMSDDEAKWAQHAHAAAERGDCPQAMELYQRLVNLTVETKESRVLGTSRWLPFLEQMRRRCWGDREATDRGGGARP